MPDIEEFASKFTEENQLMIKFPRINAKEQLLVMWQQRVPPAQADFFCKSAGLPQTLADTYLDFCKGWASCLRGEQQLREVKKAQTNTEGTVNESVAKLQNTFKVIGRATSDEFLTGEASLAEKTKYIIDRLNTETPESDSVAPEVPEDFSIEAKDVLRVLYEDFFPQSEEVPTDPDELYQSLRDFATACRAFVGVCRTFVQVTEGI